MEASSKIIYLKPEQLRDTLSNISWYCAIIASYPTMILIMYIIYNGLFEAITDMNQKKK